MKVMFNLRNNSPFILGANSYNSGYKQKVRVYFRVIFFPISDRWTENRPADLSNRRVGCSV